MIKKGEWVQIHQIVLNPDERSNHLPEDTKMVPLEMWVKGFLNMDSSLEEEAEITTLTGRIARGTLVDVNPSYKFGFGEFVPELLQIGTQLKGILEEGEANE